MDSFALLGKEIAGDVPLQVINDAEAKYPVRMPQMFQGRVRERRTKQRTEGGSKLPEVTALAVQIKAGNAALQHAA